MDYNKGIFILDLIVAVMIALSLIVGMVLLVKFIAGLL